jgi:DNA-binding response OmpR family regulator
MPAPKGRILCTEDHTDTRELLIVLLRSAGYEVICTDNAFQALKLAKSERFHLYLVDYWLPDASGITLTEWIREFDEITPILFYSGAGYDSDLKSALKAGANAYLVKPADADAILHEIDQLIERSKLVRV